MVKLGNWVDLLETTDGNKKKSPPPIWYDSRKYAGDFKRMSSNSLFFSFFFTIWNSLKIICSPLHNEPESFPGAQRQPCAGFLFSSRCEQTAAIKRGKRHNVHKPFLMGYIWRNFCEDDKSDCHIRCFHFGVWITNWVPSDLLESFVPIKHAREWIWTLKIVPVCSTFCLQSTPFKSNSVSMVTAVQQDNTFIKSQISGHHHIVLLLTYKMNTFIPNRTNILCNFNNYSKLHSAFPFCPKQKKVEYLSLNEVLYVWMNESW